MEKIKTQRFCIALILFILGFCHATKVSLTDAVVRFQTSPNLQRSHALQQSILNLKHQQLHQNTPPYFKSIKGSYTPRTNQMESNIDLTWPSPFGISFNASLSQKLDEDFPHYYIQAQVPLHKIFTTDYHQQVATLEIEKEQISANQQYLIELKDLIHLYRNLVLQTCRHQNQQQLLEIKQLELIKQQQELDYGKISQYEFDKALLQLQRDSLQVLKAETTIEHLKLKLKKILDIPNDEEIELDTAIAFRELQVENWENNSHTTTQHQLNYTITEKNYLAQKSNLSPKLNLNAKVNQDGDYDIHFEFLYTPYSPASCHKDLVNAYEYSLKQFNLEKSYHQLQSDVQELYEKIQYTDQELDLASEELKIAQTEYQITQAKFQHQQISLSENLLGMHQLRQAYTNTLEKQIEYANLVDDFNLKIGRFDESISSIL